MLFLLGIVNSPAREHLDFLGQEMRVIGHRHALGDFRFRLLRGMDHRVLVLCSINVILALSLNLVNGITGQFSIGHAGFMAVGAYASAAYTVYAVPLMLGAQGSAGGW